MTDETKTTVVEKPNEKLAQLIRQLVDGTIFNVKFVKRTTGEKRSMTCRLKVKKGVKGVGHAFDPAEKGLMCVYDMKAKGFRMVSLESVYELTVKGKKYTF